MGTNARHIRHSFNAGVWSGLLDARFDLAKYNSSCRVLENAIVLPYGGVTRSPGTKYVANTKSDGAGRLIPFVRSFSEVYMLEFTNGFIRFYKNGAQVTSGGAVYEIVSPYSTEDLPYISCIQSVDVMYLFCRTRPTYKLIYTNETEWTISPVKWRHEAFKTSNSDISKTIKATVSISSLVAWATATDYVVGNMVKNAAGTKMFTCIKNHTSSGSEPTTTTEHWYMYYDGSTYKPYIERGAPVALAASADGIFTADSIGSVIQFTCPQTATILSTKYSANGDTGWFRIKGDWNLTTGGTWKAVITIYRSLDYGNTSHEYKKFNTTNATGTNTESNYTLSSTEGEEDALYKISITGYESGTIGIEWTRTESSWQGEIGITSLVSASSIPDGSDISGLIAHYKLNDNAANATVDDATTNGYDATLKNTSGGYGNYNTSNLYDSSVYKVSVDSTPASFHFDPTKETHIVVPSSVMTALGTGSRTVALWFRFDDTPVDSEYILSINRGDHLWNKLSIYLSTAQKLVLKANAGSTTYATALTANTWYHLVVIYNGVASKVYLDGSLVITTTGTTSFATNDIFTVAAALSGGSSIFADTFDGYIDNVGIYNKALTTLDIMALLGGTSAMGIVQTPLFDNQSEADGITIATSDWALPAWTSSEGYPEHAAFMDNRLILSKDVTVWASVVDDYENFQYGTNDDDALSFFILSRHPNPIQWIIGMKKLLIGTTDGEWILGNSSTDEPITPSNPLCRQQSSYGSDNFEALKVNDLILFVQRRGRKVRELSYQYETDQWVSPDLTILSEHITKSGIVALAFQQQKHAILWAVLGDGTLGVMTYEKEHDVIGWTTRNVSGTVEDVAVLPQSASDDQVWIIVKRTINGVEKRYVEYFSDINYDNTEIKNSFFVDSGIITSVSNAKTITGLNHLEGKRVAVLADGVVLHDGYGTAAGFVVSGGTITIGTENATYGTVIVGLPYKTTIQPSGIELLEANGSRSRIKRVVSATLMLYNTAGYKYGINQTDLYTSSLPATSLYTGDDNISPMGDYNNKTSLVIQQVNPLPLTLNGIEYEVQVNE